MWHGFATVAEFSPYYTSLLLVLMVSIRYQSEKISLMIPSDKMKSIVDLKKYRPPINFYYFMDPNKYHLVSPTGEPWLFVSNVGTKNEGSQPSWLEGVKLLFTESLVI